MAASVFCFGSSQQAKDCMDAEEQESRDQFTRYNIVLGKGSYKEVYWGFDKSEGIEIAWSKIKKTPNTKITDDKLYDEAEMLKSLNHENITKCYACWIEGDYVNMITEYCSSGNLKEYIKKYKLVGNKALIKNCSRQILNALQYLHSGDQNHDPYVHCDIKSDNIFINGHTGTVKLGDLGNAVKYEESEGIKKSFKTDIYMFGLYGVAEMANKKLLYWNQWDSFFRPQQDFHSYMEKVGPSGVEDNEIKDFIKRCIVHPPDTPSAMYLLQNDPFLAVDDNDNDNDNLGAVDTSTSAGVDNLIERVGTVGDQVNRLLLKPTEFVAVNKFKSGDRKFRIQGKMSDTSAWISITLSIFQANQSVVQEKIDFEFFHGFDTAEEFTDCMKKLGILPADEEIAPVLQKNTEQLIAKLQYKLQNSNSGSKRKMPSFPLCNKF